MQKAFVTGGSGFIGQRLVDELRRRGVDVVALARSPEAATKLREAGVSIVPGEIGDREALSTGMAGADVVFHLAAKLGDWGVDAEYQRVNVDGTAAVLATARTSGVRRVVHVSTEAVLLDGRPLIDVDESRPYAQRPLGVYARPRPTPNDSSSRPMMRRSRRSSSGRGSSGGRRMQRFCARWRRLCVRAASSGLAVGAISLRPRTWRTWWRAYYLRQIVVGLARSTSLQTAHQSSFAGS